MTADTLPGRQGARPGSNQPIFGLYGAGGCGRGVMPLAAAHFESRARDLGQVRPWLCFIETAPTKAEANGYPILSKDAFFALDCGERFFNVAVADSRAREKLVRGCLDRGARPVSLHSAHAVAYDGNEIGPGAILCAFTVVTSNVRIGAYFHANLYSYVEHDCVVGDFVTFAPGVHCNGHVHIRDHAYIGSGAVIKPGSSAKPLVIGEGAVVGMGAVVTKDVAPFTTVVGNPARPLQKG